MGLGCKASGTNVPHPAGTKNYIRRPFLPHLLTAQVSVRTGGRKEREEEKKREEKREEKKGKREEGERGKKRKEGEEEEGKI
jgi:response regulator RpfG family c-di-GMP phosphodiesterase